MLSFATTQFPELKLDESSKSRELFSRNDARNVSLKKSKCFCSKMVCQYAQTAFLLLAKYYLY